ncbi:glycosyltransferase family 4 protein [Gordonia amicalis]
MDGFWCLSSAQVEACEELLGPGIPVSYLRFGVDDKFFGPEEYSDSAVLVSFGNDRDRDWETYWSAAEVIARSRRSARVVGQGRRRDQSGSPDRVLSLGRITHADVRDWYRQSAVVGVATRPNLHASGMTVALEGMATGRPVVITRTPGIEDYVVDGVTGRLVDPGDHVAFAEAVIDYMNDPDLARCHGENGRRRVSEHFNTRSMCMRLAEIVGFGVVS